MRRLLLSTIVFGALNCFFVPAQAIDFLSVDKDTTFSTKYAGEMDKHQIKVRGKFEEHKIKVAKKMDDEEDKILVRGKFEQDKIKVGRLDENKLKNIY